MPLDDSALLEDGLICASLFDGKGGGQELDWNGVTAWKPGDGLLWVHLDRTGARARNWIENESAMDPVLIRTILAPDLRPRVLPVGDALFVTLRGINLNPGADPEDMVAVRVWAEPGRIISVRHRRLMAVQDIRDRLSAGNGPCTTGDFLVRLADGLIDRMSGIIGDLEDRVDELEDRVLTGGQADLRGELSDIRRVAITLRRYLAPQRDAMNRLHAEPVAWLTALDHAMLREIADRTTRYVEDLDAARERAAVVQEELAARMADRMNRTMYVLTVLSAILLPPSLLTGLLGINVGGMPGVDHPWAFAIVAGLILGVGLLEFVLLRKLKWI